MLEVLVGLLALLIGAVFCFAGNSAMRIIFPFWGFFVGFVGGAGLVTAISGESFFGTLMSWFVGFAVGLLFAVCSYLFYSFAIVLLFASFGFTLTAAILAGIGIDWNWLVVLLGTVVAVLAAGAAIAFNAPSLALIVLTAIVGAAAMVEGIMLIFNVITLEQFSSVAALETVREEWWWFVAWAGAAILGASSQYTYYRLEVETMRELWEQSAYPEDVIPAIGKPKK